MNATTNGLGNRDIIFPNIGETLDIARSYRAYREKAYREGFTEFQRTAVPVILNGKRYRAHPNINLYVDMTSACDADCDFCIAKVIFARTPSPIPPQWLSRALDICAPANPSVQITGGEPTLFPEALKELLDVVSVRRPRRPVLNTNGRNLEAVASMLRQSAIEHINISRHHYNDNDNAKIMKRKGHEVSSVSLCDSISGMKNRVRMQCNLLDGEIDTYGEVMQFIAYCYYALGVRSVVFAQLTPLPLMSYYDPSIVKSITDAPVDVDSILDHIERDSRFVFEKYRGGVACYYEVWKFIGYEEPMTIIIKYSDNMWLEKADDDPELLPDLVLHTDGTLAGSWCKDRKIICRFDEQEKIINFHRGRRLSQ